MKLSAEKAVSVLRAREVLGLGEKMRLRHDKANAVMLAEWVRRLEEYFLAALMVSSRGPAMRSWAIPPGDSACA